MGSGASRIQRITVEIGGDTTKLSTALSKVNKEIRDTQAGKSAVALHKIGETGEDLAASSNANTNMRI